MRTLLLFISLTFVEPINAAEPICTSYDNQILAHKPNSKPTHCTEGLITRTLQPLSQNDWIPKACIQNSLELGPKHTDVPFYKCDKSNGTRVVDPHPPCINALYIDHVHQSVNSVLSCINSDAEDVITGKEVFKLINHESHFLPNVASNRGVGISQLTTSGVEGVNNYAAKVVWQSLKDKPECKKFAHLVRKDHRLFECSFLALPENPSRALLYGLLIYKAFRKIAAQKISEMNLNKDLLEQLTQSFYNLGDKGGARVAAFVKKKIQTHNEQIALSPDTFEPETALADLQLSAWSFFSKGLKSSEEREIQLSRLFNFSFEEVDLEGVIDSEGLVKRVNEAITGVGYSDKAFLSRAQESVSNAATHMQYGRESDGKTIPFTFTQEIQKSYQDTLNYNAKKPEDTQCPY